MKSRWGFQSSSPSTFGLLPHHNKYSADWVEKAQITDMTIAELDGLELAAPADFHVHLRDGAMMELVTPTLRPGGVDTVYVMPNLIPPITTVDHALDYKRRLQAIEPNVTFLMSLYLHPSITPETIKEAKAAGVTGVKSYPAGVTTNSSSGVVSYEQFYPVFEEMQTQDMVLNLHGEVPSTKGSDITVLNAEESFLPTLKDLHRRFPKLRIILEHCTSAAAVEAVKSCGPTVSATLTAHHLSLIVDDWAGDPHCFCKPVAKTPQDRKVLLQTAISGNPKFFFGSDSAPHPATSKRADKVSAGVFTQPNVVGIVLDALDQAVRDGLLKDDEIKVDHVQGFLSGYGRAFYGSVAASKGAKVRLRKAGAQIRSNLVAKDASFEVVPFRRGQTTWAIEWL
ncbi:dihydroorotase, homodimeric type [Sphaceloma murrayae]|uniref:dihydroorotase n=1 Tax=Sphaceloma murrayae TaxID=2082308 RepID=A0A2K1QZE6_9PEZI|nr:dihydroorotase, homodimeric type [Sphaceloma murrayae]